MSRIKYRPAGSRITQPARKRIADLGPWPSDDRRLVDWLWDYCRAPDATIEQRNIGAAERRRALARIAAAKDVT